MPSPLAIPESVALLASGLFTGAALYVSFVEHPARMQCGTRLAITEFAPSYKRGALMQASLSTIGTIAAIASWLQGPPPPSLLARLPPAPLTPLRLSVL